MIDLNEVEDEIARLEHGNTTYATCEKLSVLYAVRNEHTEPRKAQPYSYASAPLSVSSEFVQAFQEASPDTALEVLDEHMRAVQILYPKEYKKVLELLKAPRII